MNGWVQMGDAEGERDKLVENLDLASEVKRVSSRACHADLELKPLLIPEKTGGNHLQSAGRIAPAEGFPPAHNLKRLIQKNGLADFSPKVESQDHLGFFAFCMELTSMIPIKFLSAIARDVHPFDCLHKYYTDLGFLLKEN
jgi:hypothetical protein